MWNEISVLITFESDWKKAKGLLADILEKNAPKIAPADLRRLREHLTDRYPIKLGKMTPIVYTDVEADGVELTLRYLVSPRKRRGSKQVIWEAILDAFAQEPDIELAYDTKRVYIRNGDGLNVGK